MDIRIAILGQESAYQGEHRWFNFYGMNIGLPVDRLEKAKPILRKRGDRMDLPYIHGMMRETMELFFDTPDNVSYASLRSEEHTSELQSLMRISYAVFCLKKKTINRTHTSD